MNDVDDIDDEYDATYWDPLWHMTQAFQFVPHEHLYLALMGLMYYSRDAEDFRLETAFDIVAQYGYTGAYSPRQEGSTEVTTKTAVAAPEPGKAPISEKDIETFLAKMAFIMPTDAVDPFEGWLIDGKKGTE